MGAFNKASIFAYRAIANNLIGFQTAVSKSLAYNPKLRYRAGGAMASYGVDTKEARRLQMMHGFRGLAGRGAAVGAAWGAGSTMASGDFDPGDIARSTIGGGLTGAALLGGAGAGARFYGGLSKNYGGDVMAGWTNAKMSGLRGKMRGSYSRYRSQGLSGAIGKPLP